MVTKAIPILHLRDSLQSHFFLGVLDLAKGNEVDFLSFSLNTTYKLQPLYRSIYGFFTKFVSNDSDAWLRRHTGNLHFIYIETVAAKCTHTREHKVWMVAV
jgi:hypothetical protein